MIDVILKIMTQIIISDYSSLKYQKDEAKKSSQIITRIINFNTHISFCICFFEASFALNIKTPHDINGFMLLVLRLFSFVFRFYACIQNRPLNYNFLLKKSKKKELL